MSAADDPDPRSGPVAAVRWFLRTDDESVVFVRELLSSAAVVLSIGLLLFAISGVWPPLVAVESGSMEPNMYPGDLVFVVDENRFVPASAYDGTGVVPAALGTEAEYSKFGGAGDVIVYTAPNRVGPPIIHRAMFWVDEGERWYDRANPEYVDGSSCVAVENCPAPHAGFITKGDNNAYYDQVSGISSPVRPEWIRGTAEARVPWLGCVRLYVSGNVPPRCDF